MHFTQLSSTALVRSGPRGPVIDDYSLTSWMRNTWSTLHLSPLRVTYLRCRCWTPQVSHVSLGREICMGRRDTVKICEHVQVVKNWSMVSLSMEAPLHGHWSVYQEFSGYGVKTLNAIQSYVFVESAICPMW
ncbi:unnamed protein product [Sphagnum jensenii]|uniref:Uncharacterized protein n=1 Tax=Sphagnum jensenii TaxID=128206 RepID=A0ABP1AMF7_9BRYO